MNLGKLAITVTNYDQCFQLLNHFDSYNANMPISYLVLTPLWLGRTINWINELYHYFRFKILINLFFVCKERNDQGVQEFIQFQMMKSINTVLLMSTGFVSFFNGQPQKFGTYMFFSKVLNISLISYCVIGRDTFEGIRDSIVEQLVSAIKLTGTPQDEDILERAIGDREFAVKSLGGLFDHLL